MLSDQEKKRYSRHLLLGDIGEAGQLKLSRSKVLIIGLGGLGSPVALYLAASGIGHMLLADGDTLEVTNLQRQIMFDSHGAGEPKADLAEARLSDLNPEIEIDVIDQALTEEDLLEYVPDVDLVLDCSDNLETRKAVNKVCVESCIPLVSAAAIRWEGHLMLFDFRKPETPCYECLYPPDATEPVLNCSTSGVVGPLLGVLGSMQALEAIKLLLGMDLDLNGRLLIFDGKYHQWQNFRIQKKDDCSVCGAH
ncbi:MAG: HesA/MoeB/ThiF family protein [Porticoccus sp.]|nr:HesA/MoeB/ThiF family protein [Porticoccus sp.]